MKLNLIIRWTNSRSRKITSKKLGTSRINKAPFWKRIEIRGDYSRVDQLVINWKEVLWKLNDWIPTINELSHWPIEKINLRRSKILWLAIRWTLKIIMLKLRTLWLIDET